ncbi:hypothetical protein GCM10010259_57990 [Streptomyces daghestanicus]|uniref:Secreted protein n=1 Tax=Streptomyces daghestanicus TaxID=66885 RepID=A0ABQ3PU20_9ACTN|nr:hypothetical protein GCM10010259_57990 [Streptomyces daghestanicus]GHI28526.1 hypothetical protein Sdagh_02560 [Streptomyces daghestanicus]
MATVTIRLSVVGVTLGVMTYGSDVTDTPRVDRDAEAARFDAEPDHGLRDPRVRDAWAGRCAPGCRTPRPTSSASAAARAASPS